MPIKPIHANRWMIDSLRQEDIGSLHRLELDDEVKKYLGGPTRHSLEQYETGFLKRQTGEYNVMGIFGKERTPFIGRCGLSPDQWGGRELSVVLGKEFWEDRYGTEIGTALIEVALQDLGAPFLTGIVHPENIPSTKLLSRLGFSLNSEMKSLREPQSLVFELWQGQ